MLTRQTLTNSDQYFGSRLAEIRKNYPAESTLILAENWHHVQYYLPGYKVVPFNLGAKWEVDEGAPVNNPAYMEQGAPVDWGLQAGDAQVVVFDPSLTGYTGSPALLEPVPLAGQNTLEVLEFPARSIFYVNANSYGVEEK